MLKGIIPSLLVEEITMPEDMKRPASLSIRVSEGPPISLSSASPFPFPLIENVTDGMKMSGYREATSVSFCSVSLSAILNTNPKCLAMRMTV